VGTGAWLTCERRLTNDERNLLLKARLPGFQRVNHRVVRQPKSIPEPLEVGDEGFGIVSGSNAGMRLHGNGRNVVEQGGRRAIEDIVLGSFAVELKPVAVFNALLVKYCFQGASLDIFPNNRFGDQRFAWVSNEGVGRQGLVLRRPNADCPVCSSHG
jgi:hypothetical protein